MLPYHLKLAEKQPRGKPKKRQQEDDVNTTTTSIFLQENPMAHGMKKDLHDMQIRFCGRLLEASKRTTRKKKKDEGGDQEREIEDNSEDCVNHDVGKFFGIFKKEFASSKGGMFHNLCPTRCNREAFSQLLYSSCFDLLKGSFSSTDSNRDDDSEKSDEMFLLQESAFAVFALFALWETNPLPRSIDPDNPLENLTMGLRDPEDPRALYRRYFHQNIRIDRPHFVLMLRLREIALSIQAGCEEEYFSTTLRRLKRKRRQQEQQREDARGSQSNMHRSKPRKEEEEDDDDDDDDDCIEWHCSCGLATDILEVTDRLFTKFRLCEYTGPLGLDALVWNADYNYKFCQPHDPTGGPDREVQIEKAVDEYKNHIDTIRNAEDIMTTSGRRSNEIVNALLASMSDDDSTMTPGDKQHKDGTQNTFTNLSEARNGIESNDRQQNIHLTQKNEEVAQYDIVVSSTQHSPIKQRLILCLKKLAERDRPMPVLQLPLAPGNVAHDASTIDDLSSVGDSGAASVWTCQGRNALQSLLRQVQNNGSKNGRSDAFIRSAIEKGSGRSNEKTTDENTANAFLMSTKDGSDIHDPGEDDDANSVDSDVTFDAVLSDDHDSDADEMVSVATSAVGRRALRDLLGAVSAAENGSNEGRKGPMRKRRPQRSDATARKRIKTARKNPAMNSGQKALSQLLDRALAPSSDHSSSEGGGNSKLLATTTTTTIVTSLRQWGRGVKH